MEWNVDLLVQVPDEEHQMALDFKDVSDRLDVFDHAIILNENDPLVEHSDALGEVITVEGDPTCENLTRKVADEYLSRFENVIRAEVEMAETDKYAMSASNFASVEEES
jgi:6-pyruvoyl-tetrahydropterin synthase